MSPIVNHALELGLVLSLFYLGSCSWFCERTRRSCSTIHPPDVRAKWGPMTDRTKRQRLLVAGVFLVVVLGRWHGLSRRSQLSRRAILGFAIAFAHFAIMFGTFDLLDWLLLDWALVYWQPRFLVLRGFQKVWQLHRLLVSLSRLLDRHPDCSGWKRIIGRDRLDHSMNSRRTSAALICKADAAAPRPGRACCQRARAGN